MVIGRIQMNYKVMYIYIYYVNNFLAQSNLLLTLRVEVCILGFRKILIFVKIDENYVMQWLMV